MFAEAFILARPWALLSDPEEDNRWDVRQGEPSLVLAASCGLSVVARSTLQIKFSGRRTLTAQREGGPFVWGGETQCFWTLPIGSAADEAKCRIVFEATDLAVGAVDIGLRGLPVRPEKPGMASHPEQLLTLLLAITERVRSLVDGETGEVNYEAIGRKLVAASVSWAKVSEKWCLAYDADHPPPLDVIVRHAQALSQIVELLATKPRRILKRERERLPISRVQELDPTCLEWYVRQPGRSTAEKAGARQAILAVVRQENFNTLENRVLRSYLLLAATAAQSYLDLHPALLGSERLRLVGRFGRMSRHLARGLAEIGVKTADGTVAPNYVLSHDNRYRQVWESYLELLRRKQEEDDIWRWQGRLWAEFVRISILVALRRVAGALIMAEVPMQVRTDQERGRWTAMAPHVSTIAMPIGDRRVVVTVIDSQDADASEFGEQRLWSYLWSVGPSCVIHSQDLETGEVTWIVVWSLHPLDAVPLNLAGEAKSANVALANLRERIRFDGGGKPLLRGLVLSSTADATADIGEGDCGDVVAYSCPLSPDRLTVVVDKLVDMLPVAIGS